MFERLTYRSVIVTGPHRSGTTICTEIVGHDTGLEIFREESFGYRDIIRAQRLIQQGGVFQGPYLLPWIPVLADDETMVLYMHRPNDEIAASVERLKQRGISTPYFDHDQARKLWRRIHHLCPHAEVVAYESMRAHPLWRDSRQGWGHRQTC